MIIGKYDREPVPTVRTRRQSAQIVEGVPGVTAPLPVQDCDWAATKFLWLYRNRGHFTRLHVRSSEEQNSALERIITENHGVRITILGADGKKDIQWVGLLRYENECIVLYGSIVTRLGTIYRYELDSCHILIEHSVQQCPNGRKYVSQYVAHLEGGA